jgi:UDP-2,3-diacylglucosamine pyrophosphatase LpxH
MKVDALFISDVHLGSKGSNAKELLNLLKEYEPEKLFIVGDFIDGWLLKSRHYWKQDFTAIIRKILAISKQSEIIYVTGNHDDFLRHYTPLELGKNIKIVDEYVWNDYYITHGDLYDGVVQMKWLGVLGGWGYEVAIGIDRFLKRLGYKKSLSKWIKLKVKDAVKFIVSFEKQLIYQAHKKGCVGVICGHIHTPEIKTYNDLTYINCGDWIENNSYIVYVKNKFKLKYYKNGKGNT